MCTVIGSPALTSVGAADTSKSNCPIAPLKSAGRLSAGSGRTSIVTGSAVRSVGRACVIDRKSSKNELRRRARWTTERLSVVGPIGDAPGRSGVIVVRNLKTVQRRFRMISWRCEGCAVNLSTA
jgi:hypothetical protein